MPIGKMFERVMASKTDEELEAIIHDKEDYVHEARMAAVQELERRNGESEAHVDIKTEIEEAERVSEGERLKHERPAGLPKQFDHAAWLLYASLGLSLLAFIIRVGLNEYYVVTEQVTISGEIEFVQETRVNMTPGLMTWLFLGLIYLLFVYFISKAQIGKNWARIVLAVLLGLGTISTLLDFMTQESFDKYSLFNIVEVILTTTGLTMLFVGDAHRWFTAAKYDTEVLDKDF